ncbi:hypothetical protein C8J57DRAFT_1494247 [Mycena rebaudengoi]|nr:hypothetical protein C8J57DRAFT_1494247 [Mycena rebaudengoi]
MGKRATRFFQRPPRPPASPSSSSSLHYGPHILRWTHNTGNGLHEAPNPTQRARRASANRVPVTVANLLANRCRAAARSVGNDTTCTASQNPARCSSEREATGGETLCPLLLKTPCAALLSVNPTPSPVRCSSEREALEDGLGYGRDFVNKDDTALKAREDFPATLPDDRALYAWPCPPFTHMRAFHPTELTLTQPFTHALHPNSEFLASRNGSAFVAADTGVVPAGDEGAWGGGGRGARGSRRARM